MRTDPNYEEFRQTVLKRDGFRCQMPECESTHNLVVHHIKPYAKAASLRTEPDNGITLCRHCHKRTFGKEKRYAAMFLAIIQANSV